MLKINAQKKYEASKNSSGSLTGTNNEEGDGIDTRVCISLLGEAHVWLEGNGLQVDVPIRSSMSSP